MQIKMRKAEVADANLLAQIHVGAWQKAYAGIIPDEFLADRTVEKREPRFRDALRQNLEETYIAESEGKGMGLLTIGQARDADLDKEAIGEIWGIYLDPQYWRRGIGREMLEWGVRQLAGRGNTSVIIWVLAENKRARAFYEACGFAPDGATKTLNLCKELEVVRYRKQL